VVLADLPGQPARTLFIETLLPGTTAACWWGAIWRFVPLERLPGPHHRGDVPVVVGVLGAFLIRGRCWHACGKSADGLGHHAGVCVIACRSAAKSSRRVAHLNGMLDHIST
jgi:hypothetical protein